MTEDKKILKININAKMLKDMLKIQNSAVDEQRISFNHKSIDMSGCDPSHVYMITQKIPMAAIEEYKMINGDKDKIELGIDIEKLLTVFNGPIKKTESIILEYNADQEKLITVFNNFTKNNALLTLDGMPENPKIPTLDLPAYATIDLKEFYNFLKQAGTVSDHFCIKMTRDKLFLIAIGDADKVKLEYTKDQLKEFNCNNSYLSLFSIEIVINIVRWLKMHYDNCTLYINNDNPFKMICKNGTETEVLVAPRIEDNNNYDEYTNYCNNDDNNIKEPDQEPIKEPEPDQEPIKEPDQEPQGIKPDIIEPEPIIKEPDAPEPEALESTKKELNRIANQIEDIDPEPVKMRVEPGQEEPRINNSGDVITLKNGARVKLFTTEELNQAAKDFKAQGKRIKRHRYFKILDLIKHKKMDQQIRNIGLYQDIDPTIIIDVLELYNYTWHREKIGGC